MLGAVNRVLIGILFLSALTLEAASPLLIYAEATSGSGQSFQVGGTNFEAVITEVVERQGELSALAGEPFVAQLSYLGVPNSAIFTVSADGKSATLEIPVANFKKDFKASSPEALNDQVQSFLRKDGSKQLAEMRRQINKLSPVGITDGNPNSTTSLMASEFFDALALNSNRMLENDTNPDMPARISLISEGGAFNAGGFHGWRVSARVQADYRIHRKISLVAILPINYVNLEGATVKGIGGGLGAPIAIIGNFDERATRFILAPFVGGMFRWSEDLAGGGALVTAGMNSSLSIPWGDSWETAAIFQISDYRGVPFDVDGYELDKVVDQQVMKVGGQVVYKFTERFLAEAYGIANRYLQDAAIQEWATIGAGLRMRLWRRWAIGGSYELDTGQGYNANIGRLTLGMRF